MECLIPEYLGLLNEKDKEMIWYIVLTYETTQPFRCFFLKSQQQKLSLSSADPYFYNRAYFLKRPKV